MKIIKAEIDRSGYLHCILDGGGDFVATAKQYLLEWGAVIVIPPLALKWPEWKMSVPKIGEYSASAIHRLTTDPVILCIARRARSLTNGAVPGLRVVEVPGVEEALAELLSGKDTYGEPWPVPQAKLVPLEYTIEEAKS